MNETSRRREIQQAYNESHGITPESIKSKIKDVLGSVEERDYVTVDLQSDDEGVMPHELPGLIKDLKKQMSQAAEQLEFEQAAQLRDRIKHLQELDLSWR